MGKTVNGSNSLWPKSCFHVQSGAAYNCVNHGRRNKAIFVHGYIDFRMPHTDSRASEHISIDLSVTSSGKINNQS